MSGLSASYFGPLGSTIHHLRADAATVAALAGLDWTRRFRRVWLDPARGVVVLMSPSHLHEGLTGVFDDIVRAAADAMGRASAKLRSLRRRGEGEPRGTGMEPDCSFYVGERALAYFEALDESEKAAEAFAEENAPDLVVEVEITRADRGKIARYADLGVREFWRLRGERGEKALRSADFLALRRGAPPRPLPASEVLPGLTPGDVCQAVEEVRSSPYLRDGSEAVARIVRRRRRQSIRVREERAPYGSAAAAGVPADDGAAAPPSTSYRGPLGSTIYRVEADAATVAALAVLDWSACFPRVCLDPVREVVVLMAPSPLHEGLAGVFDDLVGSAAVALGRASKTLGRVRLRGEGEPPGTGMEPDGAFYLGERARAYGEALAGGEGAGESFLGKNGPDLVVEVEMTRADEGKIARYAALGVREFWRLDGKRGGKEIRADFLTLRRGAPPLPLTASAVLPGFTPSDAGEAAEAALSSPNLRERVAAAAPTARRRAQPGARARGEPAAYGAARADRGPAVAAAAAVPVEGWSAEEA